MKKIKLFALTALLAMGTNAFAQGTSATKLFTFTFDVSKHATITGFVSELDDEFKSSVAIPDSVTDATDATKKYDVQGIAENAFKGQPITAITFYAPKKSADNNNFGDQVGVKTIGANAFQGTKITELNLANTTITKVENLFGTTLTGSKDVANSTILSVTLPATVTEIAEGAFGNCTKLATIDMSKATGLTTIGAKAFAGCAVKALDFSKSTAALTTIPADAINDGTVFKTNATLETVSLPKGFTTLTNAFKSCTALTTVSGLESTTTAVTSIPANAFEGDVALTTINTKTITTFSKECFKGCTALTSISFAALTATGLAESAFEGSGLTSATFPAAVTTIPAKAFWQCENLATVKFEVATTDPKVSQLTTIKGQAFGYTGLTKVEIPALTNELAVEKNAFVGCEDLKDFTYAPETTPTTSWVDVDAFARCSDVAFHTTSDYATKWATAKSLEDPNNAKFDFNTDPETTALTPTPYSTNPSKFYVKWNGKNAKGVDTAIKIKKDDAKVYGAYVDATDGSISMVQYKNENGYVYIGQGHVALIITSKSDLAYEAGTDDKSTSWQATTFANAAGNQTTTYAVITGDSKNALNYVTSATTRADLESAVDEDYYIYGWVKAGGFQKVTTGKNIPEGTLFIYAKDTSAAGRMMIKWYDENGNLENETTAIETIEAIEAANGESFNLAGQRVNGNYKGVVIKNGKKVIIK